MAELDDLDLSALNEILADVAEGGDEEGDNRVTGTPLAHYSGPEDGPFKCSHCTHSEDAIYCDHPDVIEDLGAGENSKAEVHPDGCCGYFRSKGD